MLLNIISAVWYAGLSIVGFIGNLLVILTISLNRKLHLKRYVIPASLAFCDFLFAILVAPFRCVARWKEGWILGEFWCDATAFLAWTSYFVTLVHLCAVSYDRYKAVVKEPLLYSAPFTKRNMAEMVAWLWILPAAICTGAFTAAELRYNEDTFVCEQGWKEKKGVSDVIVIVFFLVGTLIVPIVVIVKLNYAVFKTVREKARTFPAITSHADTIRRKRSLKVHRAAIDVFIIVALFLVLFLPAWIGIIVRRFVRQDEFSAGLFMFLIDIAYSSAVWNPFVYVIRKREFRRAMYSMLKCQGRRRERVQVIPQRPVPAQRAVQEGVRNAPAVTGDAAPTAPH